MKRFFKSIGIALFAMLIICGGFAIVVALAYLGVAIMSWLGVSNPISRGVGAGVFLIAVAVAVNAFCETWTDHR